MNTQILQKWKLLPFMERTITLLVLILLWGGIAFAITLEYLGVIADSGSFFWGCIFGSFFLAYLAAIKKKRDIVSLMTPLYAIIIFMGLELPPNLVLQTLYAASLTVLLWRLHTNFS